MILYWHYHRRLGMWKPLVFLESSLPLLKVWRVDPLHNIPCEVQVADANSWRNLLAHDANMWICQETAWRHRLALQPILALQALQARWFKRSICIWDFPTSSLTCRLSDPAQSFVCYASWFGVFVLWKSWEATGWWFKRSFGFPGLQWAKWKEPWPYLAIASGCWYPYMLCGRLSHWDY